MRSVEVEFEDEVELRSNEGSVLAEIEATGDVDRDGNIHNVKLVSIYSKDHSQSIKAKDLSLSDMKRVIEKATDALLGAYEKDYDPNFTEFDDDYYYDQFTDGEESV